MATTRQYVAYGELLADGVAEVEDVDQFFDEAYKCFEHGIAPVIG
ncbi:hypothetical protein [Achromobacter spanius]|nr:hypothetical protein [Achromobacter spanius]